MCEQRQTIAFYADNSSLLDILPRLKTGDSYGGQTCAWRTSVGSCCWRHDCTAHFTG